MLLAKQFTLDFPDESPSPATIVMEAIGLFAKAHVETEKPDWLFEAEMQVVGINAMMDRLVRP